MPEHRRSEGYNILRDGDFCAECGETWPCSGERINLLTTDLQRIAHELGIGAKPYSGHEAMEKDILPAIKAGVAARALLRDAADSLRKIALDDDAAYLACADVPFCTKGKAWEHSGECAVRIAWDALARIEGGAS